MPGNIRPLAAQDTAGSTLKAIDQRGNGNLGRIGHQQVNVIPLAIKFFQRCAKVLADLREQLTQPCNGSLIKYISAVFCDEDQMHMHVKNAVPASPDVIDFIHRPNHNKTMRRLQAFKFELCPDGAQQRLMRQFAGASRYVFNRGLSLQQEHHKSNGKKLSYADMCKALTAWKTDPETPWLKEPHSQVLQQSLKNLEAAYQNFFAQRAKFPQFKKKGFSDSFRYPQGVKLDQAKGRVFLPKLGWMKYRASRTVLGEIKNTTISLKAGRWHVSFQTEREVDIVRHPAVTAVGIDLGIVRFATLWDGQQEKVIAPLHSFKRHQVRLVKAQRQLSHKVKFSSNWKRAKARVQKIHHQIANARNDFLHKASHSISQSHALLCLEDLQVSNMSRSAKGTPESPGRQVRAKAGLNRSILDQGFGEFRRQLEYKSAWCGGDAIAVSPQNTSRTCPCCGYVSAENRLSQAVFLCVACAHTENADLIAAKNIRERGLNSLKGQGYGRIACEVNGAVRPSAAGTHRSEHLASVK